MRITRHVPILSLCLICLLGAGGVTVWQNRHDTPIPLRLGDSGAPTGKFLLPDGPLYKQTDARWGDMTIGGSGERLRNVGCTLCCLSMALALHGKDLPPDKLNAAFIEKDGYTEQGWVKWDTIHRVTDGKVRVRVPRQLRHANIVNALRDGNPVLVKVALPSGIHHWVLVVGWENRDYLIYDPLSPSKGHEPLSSYDSDILAVRIVEKV